MWFWFSKEGGYLGLVIKSLSPTKLQENLLHNVLGGGGKKFFLRVGVDG